MLITAKQYKLNKSAGAGFVSAGLNLSPADEARLFTGRQDLPNMCPNAGACATVCLKYAGLNNMPTHTPARVQRTLQIVDHFDMTIAQIVREIISVQSKALAAGSRFAFRPNLLSDWPKIGHALAAALPSTQFYDYTKIARPWTRTRENYHLTFSYSERSSWAEVEECIAHGVNVALVFDRLKGDELPAAFRGYPVIDGDVNDLRFLDAPGHVVGLRFKGARAKMSAAITAGFVLEA